MRPRLSWRNTSGPVRMAETQSPFPPFDPLADLMVGLAALILVLATVIAPVAVATAPGGAKPAESAESKGWRLDEKSVRPFIASREGVMAPGIGFIRLEAMLDDSRLSGAVLGARPFLMVVEAGGEEAAFTLEALAAASGLGNVAIVRQAATRP